MRKFYLWMKTFEESGCLKGWKRAPINFHKINNDIKDDVNNYNQRKRKTEWLREKIKGIFSSSLISGDANLFSFRRG